MRNNPSNETSTLAPFRNDLARLFDVRNWAIPSFDDEGALMADWRPAVDVDERDGDYVVRADLPGIDPENIDVTLEDGVLTLRGERKEERREDKAGYHRLERFTGSFFRRLALPDVTDSDSVKARFDKGVLEITIPKAEKTKARKISIQS